MRIALDGVDGAGKSSVTEKLANKFGCNIARLTYNGDRSFAAYVNFMLCENVVHDRTFISEIIYPKYFGKDSRLNPSVIESLYEMLTCQGINVFILTASDETILERIGKRGDEFIDDMNKFKAINRDYLELAKVHNFIVIDTTNKTIDEVVEEIGGYFQ